MHDYFARLAQRSDVAPAVMAPRAPAGYAPADGGGYEQHTEVIVTPSAGTGAGDTVTPDGPTSIAPPPGEAKAVASSAFASPKLSLGMDTETENSHASPVQAARMHREVPDVATPAARPALDKAPVSIAAPDTTDSSPSRRRDDEQMQYDSSATRAVTERSVPGVARDEDADSPTRPTPRARLFPHTDTQSPQPAAASTRAPLQVHIGRIELEVHQPSPAIAPPPAPAAPPAAPPRRSASFNPRRYYLRGP